MGRAAQKAQEQRWELMAGGGVQVRNDARWESLSDLELARAASEELDAFAELIRRHQDFVFGAVLRVVKDRTQAEDLAQEAFLRAHRALDGFRGDAAVRSWLYRIATNLAKNAVTRKREYPTETMPEHADTDRGPQRQLEAAEMRAHLREAIGELPDDLRVPLVLREYDELSYQEIATSTGLPLNTVRTRILRARRALANKMEAWR